MVEVQDLVLRLLDNHVEPHAEVRGDHVHQAEISHRFRRGNRHLQRRMKRDIRGPSRRLRSVPLR